MVSNENVINDLFYFYMKVKYVCFGEGEFGAGCGECGAGCECGSEGGCGGGGGGGATLSCNTDDIRGDSILNCNNGKKMIETECSDSGVRVDRVDGSGRSGATSGCKSGDFGTGFSGSNPPSAITLVNCWLIKRRDGVVLGFTEYDHDLHIDGVCYLARSGANASASHSSVGCEIDNMDIECALSSELITDNDITCGRYNHAEVESFIVDYQDLTAGKMAFKRGWLGEIKSSGASFIGEVRGLTQNFSANVGEVYSPVCRAKFGDHRCKMRESSWKISGLKVTAIGRYSIFRSEDLLQYLAVLDGGCGVGDSTLNCNSGEGVGKSTIECSKDASSGDINGEFSSKCGQRRFKAKELWRILGNGYVRFVSGSNRELKFEIKSFSDSGEINLKFATPNPVEVGDCFEIIGGCDRSFAMCCEIFNNGINFRGEPHIPILNNIEAGVTAA